jgi:hypothetical protein
MAKIAYHTGNNTNDLIIKTMFVATMMTKSIIFENGN